MGGLKRDVLTMSSRGQITLPAGMRKHLGITPGSALIVEELDGELRLKPAAIVELHHHSDAQIQEWDSADALPSAERDAILQRLSGR
ncbi:MULTISPECIES: AbrB/MazE/SpoVT family DNA-binding domain-containing protein [unclassified Cyanobium]|uniref:AbrB/MazE/SpoVT family DNA-binding domain-containing protein n=1 Tax=unclassified Cyanobium TaxID=2627006 RepID=UPI0020CB8B45|nr:MULTISPECIES: AbrB/MazE/SpoVT family DNA-binding domain-containing protein [unclassified Cyanobium]MCP9833842.1 AbrB/MazE/SpoVT family DNA-binding domain-containing protein [Cyanobium sp. La Preciosa 7G6]MCP9936400.1 AbrB/MazE/SpoVT family DNA-binding domain-containing protein [Cyanobium sp. Aljojuca 7A6]